MTADWIAMLEAIAADHPDLQTWARGVLEAAGPLFEGTGADSLALGIMQHSADCTRIECLMQLGTGCWSDREQLASGVHTLPRALGPLWIHSLFYPPNLVSVQSELTRTWPATSRDYVEQYRHRLGITDSIGAVTQPLPGRVALLCSGHGSTLALSPRQRRLLTLVALHLGTGYRLRVRPQCLLAVIRPDGRVLHRGAGSPPAHVLVSTVRRIERARSRRLRHDPDAAWLWHALIEGRASIIERTEGAQRLYLVIENGPELPRFRFLSNDEISTLTHAASGMTSKQIAYGLGVSESALSLRLEHASQKLGLSTRTEAIRLAAILLRDPRAQFETSDLTEAEQQILALVVRGLSNSAIANLRQRSVRTIANQVAALLKKTGAPSRRSLVAGVAANPDQRFLQKQVDELAYSKSSSVEERQSSTKGSSGPVMTTSDPRGDRRS